MSPKVRMRPYHLLYFAKPSWLTQPDLTRRPVRLNKIQSLCRNTRVSAQPPAWHCWAQMPGDHRLWSHLVTQWCRVREEARSRLIAPSTSGAEMRTYEKNPRESSFWASLTERALANCPLCISKFFLPKKLKNEGKRCAACQMEMRKPHIPH